MIKRTTLLYTFLFALTLSLGGVSFESPANPLVRKGAQKAMETCKKKQGGCLEGAKKAADSFVKKVKSKGKSTKQTPSKTTQQTSHSTKNTKQSDGKSSTKRTKQSDNKNSTKSSNTRPNNATQLNNNRTGDPSSHNQANLPRNSSSNKPTNVSDKAYKKHIDKALPGKKNQVKQVARNIRRDKCKNKTSKQCDVLIDKELEKQNLVKSSNYKRTNSQQPPPKSKPKPKPSSVNDPSNIAMIGSVKAPKKRANSAFSYKAGTCCFVAGTQVLTENGYKNIEDIKLGEKLRAKNIQTGQHDWKPVTRVFIEPDRQIFEIKLKGVDGYEQKIQTTDDHPFYVADQGWRATVELNIGDNIETDGYGLMEVINVTDLQRIDLTYNFTVKDFHTYYVTKKNVLVHNCNKNYRQKTRGANKRDLKQVNDAAKEAGIKDRRNFGKFIEKEKKAEGRGASDNYTYDELLQLAKDFKANGGK